MPDTPISGLPQADTLSDADTLVGVQSFQTKKLSVGALRAYLQSKFAAVAFSGAYADLSGRPNLAAVALSGAKVDVGLGNVDNTSDANKPVSTAQQDALDLKAPLASPVFTGNVGIGAPPNTWAPGTSAVQGNGGGLWFRSPADGMHLMANCYFDGASYKLVGDGFASQYMQQAGGHYWYGPVDGAASGVAGAGAGITTRMSITLDGKVGIGTAAPATKLHVAGDSNGALQLDHSYNYSSPNWALKLNGQPGTPGGYLSQAPAAGGFMLSQGGNYYGVGNYATDANSTSFAAILGNGGVLTFMTASGLAAGGQFSGTERMRLTPVGNLGIGGVPSDTERLYLLTDNGQQCVIRLGQYTQRDWYLGLKAGSPNFTITDASAGLDRVTVDTTGGLLIGTAENPDTAKLRVYGFAQVVGPLNASGVAGAHAQGAWIEWNRSNGGGETCILNQRGGGGGGITFGEVDTANNVTEHGRFDSNGNFLIGGSTGYGARLFVDRLGGEGDFLAGFRGVSASSTLDMYAVATLNANSTYTALKVGMNSSTNRSINAAGTFNASGADYAEYMIKADDCGTVPKGAIVGVDANGKLTDKWANAVSFLIKSTDPSYVGGDVWGTEEVIGTQRPQQPVYEAPAYTGSENPGAAPVEPIAPTLAQPVEPTAPASDATDEEVAAYQTACAEYRTALATYTDAQTAYQAALSAYHTAKTAYDAALVTYQADQAEYAQARAGTRQHFDQITMPAYEADLATFNTALEAARQKVDRIAYCGQVPVNVTGATPGQYIVPMQDGDGIAGQLVSDADITFAQYRRAVGIVQNILPDGRANVRVKVS